MGQLAPKSLSRSFRSAIIRGVPWATASASLAFPRPVAAPPSALTPRRVGRRRRAGQPPPAERAGHQAWCPLTPRFRAVPRAPVAAGGLPSVRPVRPRLPLDGSEAEESTVLAAHEDPEAVDKELERRFRPETSRRRPLYMAYSVPEGQDLPAPGFRRVCERARSLRLPGEPNHHGEVQGRPGARVLPH